MSGRVPGRPSPAVARLVVAAIGVVFLVPLVAMLEFTLRTVDGGYGLGHWASLFDPEKERSYRVLFTGLQNSLVLAVITLAIVLFLFFPTVVLVHLRYPRLHRALDLVTVLPIAIPAIVLVVGFAPIYRGIGQAVGVGRVDAARWPTACSCSRLPTARSSQTSPGWTPKVRAEAARSLGASWPTVLLRVIAPGVRRGLLAASLITIAIVLGEFTVSSLLNRTTLQTALLQISQSDPFVAVAVSLLSLIGAFVLLLIVSATNAAPKRRGTRRGTASTKEASRGR